MNVPLAKENRNLFIFSTLQGAFIGGNLLAVRFFLDFGKTILGFLYNILPEGQSR